MSSPTVDNWAAIEHILCYLKGAPGRGILYSNYGHNRVECFTNADLAGSKENRRSTSGLLVEIWSHGRVRSKGLFPVQVQSQNIEQWHSPRVKSCGFINS